MDYVKPAEVVEAMVAAGDTKGSLPTKDLLIRGILSGALLGRHQFGRNRHSSNQCPFSGSIDFSGWFRANRFARVGIGNWKFCSPAIGRHRPQAFGQANANQFWVGVVGKSNWQRVVRGSIDRSTRDVWTIS